jgi:hypothetical protein
MRLVFLVTAVFLVADARAGEPTPTRLDFSGKVGEVPKGWKSAVTGKAEGSAWALTQDKTAPSGALVLGQTSKNPSAVFNLCIAEDTKYKDLDLSVSFKAMAGENDQGGGLVWRYQDPNNYYVVRMNPLEDNFRLYKVVAGKRLQLASKDVKAAAGQWHTVRVVHKGSKIQCYLNGKLLIEETDDTFPQAGKVGLWTKSDAQTLFANIQVVGKKE